jgi:hypothetical protein
MPLAEASVAEHVPQSDSLTTSTKAAKLIDLADKGDSESTYMPKRSLYYSGVFPSGVESAFNEEMVGNEAYHETFRQHLNNTHEEKGQGGLDGPEDAGAAGAAGAHVEAGSSVFLPLKDLRMKRSDWSTRGNEGSVSSVPTRQLSIEPMENQSLTAKEQAQCSTCGKVMLKKSNM